MKRKATTSTERKKDQKHYTSPSPKYFELHAHGSIIHSHIGILTHGYSFVCPSNVRIAMMGGEGYCTSFPLMVPREFQTWITSDALDLEGFHRFLTTIGDADDWRCFGPGEEVHNVVFSGDDSDFFFGLWEKPFYMQLTSSGAAPLRSTDITSVMIYNHIRRYGDKSRFYNEGQGLTVEEVQKAVEPSFDTNAQRYTITAGNFTAFEYSPNATEKRGIIVGGNEVRTLARLVEELSQLYPDKWINLSIITCTSSKLVFRGRSLSSLVERRGNIIGDPKG